MIYAVKWSNEETNSEGREAWSARSHGGYTLRISRFMYEPPHKGTGIPFLVWSTWRMSIKHERKGSLLTITRDTRRRSFAAAVDFAERTLEAVRSVR